MISIDPGTKALGAAWWGGGLLLGATVSRVPQTRDLSLAATQHVINLRMFALERGLHHSGGPVAVESMEWTGGARATTVADLLNVQTVGCIVAASMGLAVTLQPVSEWKGPIAKDRHHERNRGVLSPAELLILDAAAHAAGKTHAKEVLDAVGIGLYTLGRTGRHGAARRT